MILGYDIDIKVFGEVAKTAGIKRCSSYVNNQNKKRNYTVMIKKMKKILNRTSVKNFKI